MNRYLEITHIETAQVEIRINVTDKSERQIEKLERAMLMRINDNYFVNETYSETELNPIKQ